MTLRITDTLPRVLAHPTARRAVRARAPVAERPPPERRAPGSSVEVAFSVGALLLFAGLTGLSLWVIARALAV